MSVCVLYVYEYLPTYIGEQMVVRIVLKSKRLEKIDLSFVFDNWNVLWFAWRRFAIDWTHKRMQSFKRTSY